MIIEPLCRDDAAAIEACRRLEQEAFHESKIDFLAEIERPYARVWVARLAAGEAPGGYLLAWRLGDELEIQSVASSPALRRRGLGLALVEAALAHARSSGCERALLEVRASNEAAIGLYSRLGFSVDGRRRAYYSEPVEDALLMGLATR